MRYNEFKDLYYRLTRLSDVKRLAKETGYDEELLFVIYTQRTVRDATRRYYPVKHTCPKMLRDWKRGRSFLSLANDINFPPVLLALMLLQESGISRKRFWKIAREQEPYPSKRLEKELKAVMREDPIYSEAGMQVQTERGRLGEEKLFNWLDAQGLEYRTEEDLRGNHQKTPDVLLDTPIKVDGFKIVWFESKASFGDKVEVRKNNRRQIIPYTEIFGPGAVVYWFGYVDEVEVPENVMILDESFFKREKPNVKLIE